MTVEPMPDNRALTPATARANQPRATTGPGTRPLTERGGRPPRIVLACFWTVAGWLGCVAFAVSTSAPASWHEASNHRWRELRIPASGRTGFTQLDNRQTGLTFTNTLTVLAGALNRVLYNGSGVAVGDYDGDEYPDLYFCGLNSPFRAAQLTPASGVIVADAGGDGHEDVFLSQNYFAMRAENPQAVGAVLRLERDGFRGPAREIQAGSGCRSQSEPVQLLGPRGRFNRVWIRWPGGTETTHNLPPGGGDVWLAQPPGG